MRASARGADTARVRAARAVHRPPAPGLLARDDPEPDLGYEYEGDANVIEAHISALREKLGDPDRTLIRSIRGVGYSLRG